MPPTKPTADKSAEKPTPKKSKKAAPPARPIVYPDPYCELCIGPDALTVEKAKALLGWEEVDSGDDYLFKDLEGKKVRCLNNVHNRPFYQSNCDSLVQEILQRRWKFNAEPIIVGVFGSILNGQHSLAALVLADQHRTVGTNKYRWEEVWGDDPVTIDKMVAYGVEEDDAVVNTMDTAKPRSFADVLFRSEYFGSMKDHEREKVCRVADYAIRMLWHRTGRKDDAFAPKRTHAEATAFLDAHPKLIKCVKHVYEENQAKDTEPDADGKTSKIWPIGRHVSPGYAAAAMYLMGCCESDGDEYRSGSKRAWSEKSLVWKDTWDRAEEFWVDLAQGFHPDNPLRELLHALGEHAEASVKVKLLLIAKAWNVYKLGGQALAADDLTLEYTDVPVEGAEGLPPDRVLTDTTGFGGIDLGPTAEKVPDPPEVSEDDPDESEPTEEEAAAMLARKAKVRAETNPTADAPPAKDLKAEFAGFRETYPDCLLLFSGGNGNHLAYGDDASTVAGILKTVAKKHADLGISTFFPSNELDTNLDRLRYAGRKVAVLTMTPEGFRGVVHEPKKAKPAGKPAR